MSLQKIYALCIFSALGISAAAQTTCEITGTTPGEACFGTSGTVSATGKPGNTIKWYDQMTGGNLLHTGATYTVNNVTTPSVYYAEASDGGVIVQDSINTLTPNNGQAGAYFDCKPLTDMKVTGFNFVPRSSATFTVSIYFKTGTFVGSETNSSAWTLLGTSSSFSATANVLTNIPLSLSQQLTANQTYAFYVIASGGTLGYTNGTTLGAIVTSNSDIEVYQGKGSGGLFSSSLFTVRTFSGTIRYEKGSMCVSPRVGVPLTTIDYTEVTGQKTVDSTCKGLPTNLYVATKGDILNYKWQIYDQSSMSFVDITSMPFVNNGDTLYVLSSEDTLNGAIIRCITEGKCGDDTSADMTMVVSPLPSFVTPPQDQTHEQGETAIFSVTTAGVGISYQWQVGYNESFANINDGGIYQGVKTNKLTISGVSRAQDQFQFRCIIKGSGSCATEPDTSNFGVLYVNPPVSVNTTNLDAGIALYPNPAGGNDIIVKQSANGNITGYRITDKLGRIVGAGNTQHTGITHINITNLAPGIYTLHAISKENTTTDVIRFTRL
ncbi:MAG: T9SS type A sorting domain-containing protein [Taibaiella sp.]|nr:T9SS type A sorting domain-containing protein [Taibaiella sp.]